jgi:hypothetical protein
VRTEDVDKVLRTRAHPPWRELACGGIDGLRLDPGIPECQGDCSRHGRCGGVAMYCREMVGRILAFLDASDSEGTTEVPSSGRETDVPSFGMVVRRLREHRGISVEQLSEMTRGAVSANLVAAIESDTFHPGNFEEDWFTAVLLALSEALGVSLSVLGDLCMSEGRRVAAELLRVLEVVRAGGSP